VINVTYEPREYWDRRQPLIREAARKAHGAQQAALLEAFGSIQVDSILEVGVGTGRIGSLVCERWPNATYTGIDISPTRIVEARANLPERAQLVEADLLDYEPQRTFDLVLAVEVLMHVRPADLPAAVANLLSWSGRHVFTVDWTEPITKATQPHNFLHDYAALGLTPATVVGRQSIHHTEA